MGVRTCDDNLKIADEGLRIAESFEFRRHLLLHPCLSTNYDHASIETELLISMLATHPSEQSKQGGGGMPTFYIGDARRLRKIRSERRSR